MTAQSDISVMGECPRLPVVIILGDADRAEMHCLIERLNRRISDSCRWIRAPEISGILNAAAGNGFPDLIIVLQNWSNEYSRDEINRLFAFAPLARVVVCYGAWCDSDGRNHNLWPPAVRVPVWAALSRIEHEWRLLQNASNHQLLPWSASRDETFAADHPAIEPVAGYSYLVDTPDPAFGQFIVEIMREAGHQLVEEQPAVVLIDIDPWCPSRAVVVKSLRGQFPGAIGVAIGNLVLPSIENELRALGITAVSHKLGFRPPDVDAI